MNGAPWPPGPEWSAQANQPRSPGIFLARFILPFDLGGGSLAEAEVEMEIVQPGNAWVDPLGAELARQVRVQALQALRIGRIVVGHHDRLLLHPDVSFQTGQHLL